MGTPTWGYKPGEAQIFDLAEGETLPPGWVDSPAKVAEPETRTEAEPESDASDWRKLHWKQRVKMAKELTGNLDIATPDEADRAIEEHLNAKDGQ